jgi:excinuclease ABC subunit C
LADLLGELKGSKVSLTVPLRGTKRELVALADKNAMSAYRERNDEDTSAAAVLTELSRHLHLTRLPERIECYDISTIQGRFSVGSCAVFTAGKADRSSYRHYRIKTVVGQDDFAMLREVFSRRFRADSYDRSCGPDLVIVDGGRGQLHAVQEILAELGLTGSFDLVSLAKSRITHDATAQTAEKSAERIFLPGRKNPVLLRQNSKPLLLLAAVRNEAHRFAIGYHRKLRSKEGIVSGIEAVPGIGPKRRTALLTHFGSLQHLQKASADEILAVPGFTRTIAEAVYRGLHDD